MKIVAFVVRVECPSCKGAKKVVSALSPREYMIDCFTCAGDGTVEDSITYDDFSRLLDGLVRR